MTILTIPTPDVPMAAAQFISLLSGADRFKREEIAFDMLVAGHVPSWMRSTIDVTLTFTDAKQISHVLVLEVLPDYLMIGTDGDHLRIPLFPTTAQRVADAWGCMLPTSKISDVIWAAAMNKLQPLPMGPPYDQSMMSTQRIIVHDRRVQAQMLARGCDPTKLTAGHKKDVVISNQLMKRPRQVSIFGWQQLSGVPIQPLYLGHDDQYADYSHAERMVFKQCTLDGQRDDLCRVLQDPNLCHVVSSEGPLQVLRQPGT